MKKIILNIEGMTCTACSNGLEKYLKKQNGIIEANVNLVMATVLIEYDEKRLTKKELDKLIANAGFISKGENEKESNSRRPIIEISIFSILVIFLMYISMGEMIRLHVPAIVSKHENPMNFIIISLAITVIFLFYGKDIIQNGIKNLIHKMPNMDTLVTTGVIANFLYSIYSTIQIINGNHEEIHNVYFEASCMIILFIKIGRYIDKKNKSKAVDAIKNLVNITPKKATIITENQEEKDISIDEVKIGDMLISKPGEIIAADGVVLNGEANVDESIITGESNPIKKVVNSKVIAGSMNYDGIIYYKVEHVGKESSISNIVKMVVEATNKKAKVERIADKIASKFTLIIFVISIISFVANMIITHQFSNSVNAFISVLVVACPCSLGLAVPVCMVISIGNLSKIGIATKSSETIEKLNDIDTIIFDKTGTLTNGNLTIQDRNISDNDLEILKILEKNSNHPIAKAIQNYKCNVINEDKDNQLEYIEKSKEKVENNQYNEKTKIHKKLQITEFKETAGYGVSGIIDGKKYYAGNRKFVEKINAYNNLIDEEERYLENLESIVYLFDDTKVLGIVGVKDSIKKESKVLIQNLKKIGKEVIILTGDNNVVANKIAKELSVENVVANVNPEQKLEYIEKINNKGKKVLMCGDGINDSPALKKAYIGLSVKNGTDISKDSADIILLNDDISVIADMFQLGKRTMRIVKQNLFWALFYNYLMIPIATGLFSIQINPMMASATMTFSSISVVLNSLRLK